MVTGMTPSDYFLTTVDVDGCFVLSNKTLGRVRGSEATLIMNGRLLSCGMAGGCEREAIHSFNDEMVTEERRGARRSRILEIMEYMEAVLDDMEDTD